MVGARSEVVNSQTYLLPHQKIPPTNRRSVEGHMVMRRYEDIYVVLEILIFELSHFTVDTTPPVD